MSTALLERAVALPPRERAALLALVRLEQESRPPPFPEFLSLLTINDAHRGPTPFEAWPHLVTLAGEWAAGQSQVILKARQVGVSWLAAAYALYVGQYQSSSTVLALSQGQDEAYELLGKTRSLWESLPAHLQRPLTTDSASRLAWVGGGRMIALPATQRAGRSYTATLVIADEAAMHPWAAQNYVAYKPTMDGGGQYLCISTANGASGFFHDMYFASAQGETPYQARFIPWFARPGRDNAWREQERRAFQGLPGEFAQEYPDTPAEAFVAHTGLVYPMFAAHHVTPEVPFEWDQAKWRVAGIDFGGGDPTAVVTLGVSAREHVHQFGEFYQRGPVSTQDLGEYLYSVHNEAPFDAILCDGSEPVAIETLRRMGLPTFAADKARAEGLGYVAFQLDNNRLTIDASCKHSLAEFNTYRWSERVDPFSKDRYATSTPVDHHGDAMDARRYAVMHIIRSIGAKSRVGSVPIRRA